MLQKNAVEPGTLELLIQICRMGPLLNFGLGGGTNLALRLGHRFSVDLDFFTNSGFDNAILFQTITREFPSAELLFEQNHTMMFKMGLKWILYCIPLNGKSRLI